MGLRLSMLFTLAFIIGVTTLFLAAVLSYIGITAPLVLFTAVLAFNLAQWLVSPYIVQALYGVHELRYEDAPAVYEALERLVRRAGIEKKPKLMVAEVDYPNAFAYGSPLAGKRIAVTRGLLRVLNTEEVEAVLGHELGHIAHRDVELMTFASALPALFYILGESLFGLGDDREGNTALLIGIASMVIYYIMTLAVLQLSRLREYYADRFSVELAPMRSIGAKRLMSALAKIVGATAEMKVSGNRLRVMGFKELFIADPDTALRDYRELEGYLAAEKIAKRRLTLADRLMELFSTHPNIVKRLRALEALARGED